MVAKPRDVPHSTTVIDDDDDVEEEEEVVTCFVSGDVIPLAQAVRVKLGPGQQVWMRPDLCRQPDPERRR